MAAAGAGRFPNTLLGEALSPFPNRVLWSTVTVKGIVTALEKLHGRLVGCARGEPGRVCDYKPQ